MKELKYTRLWSVKKAQPLLVFLVLLSFNSLSQTKQSNHQALIPMPQVVEWNNQNFTSGSNSSRYVRKIVKSIPGVPLNHDESYSLKVNGDSVVLEATSEKGIFRGMQTIKQLTFNENGKKLIAGCRIVDWPAFQIRGFMQDVGRNFQSLSMLKEQIDVLAAYKFNVFHFHVTDNPGWRLESEKYLQLKSAGSMSRQAGKYYSQQDFLELVNYCNDRFITLIPEFDIPGHCEAFRKAFSLDSMSDPRVEPILLDLIDELCSLVPKEKMPYIHLGTDEVWHKNEKPAPGLLSMLVERVKFHNREVIVWSPGQHIENDNTSITQLWSSAGKPKEGHRYIDSRLNYLNHLDPFAGVAQLYFDRICGAAQSDSMRMGGILCCWNDNNVKDEYDILKQNPVYPGMLTYSETSWKGQNVELGENYLAKLPPTDSELFLEFQNFEDRMIRHRDLYFQGKPFPYVRQTHMEWKIYGPIDLQSIDGQRVNGEETGENNVFADYQNYEVLGPVNGGTIHVSHFFGFPSYYAIKQGTIVASTNIWSPKNQKVECWIGFHDWSRSGGRRGGPFPKQGEWHNTNPTVWLNRKMVEPPIWKNPGLIEKTEEVPFEDENYFFRRPTTISLKKGWNEVLLKVPQNGTSWKWMFTFVPVKIKKGQVKEMEGLKFSTDNQFN